MRSAPIATVLFALLALVGCGTEPEKSPSFYADLAQPNVEIDAAAAASMISEYRRANGLPAVELDPVLMKLAQEQVRRMAAANRVTHDPGNRGLAKRLKTAGVQSERAAENVGAGYYTIAEAFSGWRDSPSHKENLLLPGATRMGIATAYAANSKYKVFWALLLAESDKPR
jgi:uncharacterized protein YkwD